MLILKENQISLRRLAVTADRYSSTHFSLENDSVHMFRVVTNSLQDQNLKKQATERFIP